MKNVTLIEFIGVFVPVMALLITVVIYLSKQKRKKVTLEPQTVDEVLTKIKGNCKYKSNEIEKKVENGHSYYIITVKGREFLSGFKKIQEFSEAFGIDI